jgi:hypothetical protein
VTGANPLRIVHATPPVVKADTKLGNWTHWGTLREVEPAAPADNFDGTPPHTGSPVPDPKAPDTEKAASEMEAAQPPPGQAKVITTTSGLRLRRLPDKGGAVIAEMPAGTVVAVLRTYGDWAQVRWNVRPGLWHSGWCRVRENGTDYLQFREG